MALRSWLTAPVLVLCLVASGAAQPPTDDLTTMQQRLGKLEELCEQLRDQNVRLQKTVTTGVSLGLPMDSSGVVPAGMGGDKKPAESKKVDEKKSDAKPADEYVEVGKNLELKGIWRNGLQLESVDKAFRVHVGGRLHNDWGWWDSDPEVMFAPGGVGPLEDGANFRRARIRVNGQMYEVVEWFMEYGFENRAHQFFDIFGEINKTPFGAFRIGHFREPFSMDALTSGNALALMERSLIQDAFVPFRNVGAMWYGSLLEEDATYALGVFRSNSDNIAIDAGDGDYALTGRLTCNPWYQDDGRYALHYGIAGSTRSLPELNASGTPVLSGGEKRVRFATRPEFRVNAPFFADTGFFPAERLDLLGVEFGLGLGSLLFQAEYVGAWPQDALLADGTRRTLFYHGWYVQGSWFITGEHRPYLRKPGLPATGGFFGQLIPHENFFCVPGEDRCCLTGRGAWELALRVSHVDLNDQSIRGGSMYDLTVGLNWYLNPNCRFMWNWIHVWRDAAIVASSGETDIFGARFQVDF